MNVTTLIKAPSRLSTLCLSFLLCLAVGQSAWAEDIEIYQAVFNADPSYEDSATNDPNVLFILDNSLSMARYRLVQEEAVDTGPQPYDPTINYSDGDDRDDNVYLYSTDMVYQGIQLSEDQNVCKAARDKFVDSSALPIHQDEYIQWTRYSGNEYGWTVNYLQSNDDRFVFECEDDNGNHGRTNNSNSKYPRICSLGTQLCSSNNGRARYRNSQQFFNGTQWPYGYIDFERVLVSGNYHAYLNGSIDPDYESANVENCDYNDELLKDEDTGVIYRCLQRFEIMKRALQLSLLGDANNPDAISLDNINLGLMRFNYNTSFSNSGGTIIDAVNVSNAPTPITSDDDVKTNRDDFIDKLKDMEFEGNTPLAESMYEAYLYYSGSAPFGSEWEARSNTQAVLDPEAVIDGFVGNSVTDETYLSPVTTNQCQGNYVVMLSDGAPTSDTSYNYLINPLPNTASCGTNCVDEMATALKENLGVYTFTIGFEFDNDLLRQTAFNGSPKNNPVDGDGYFTADSLESLSSVFSRVLGQVQAIEADSFVAPAVTVNAFNRLQNREDIYYAVFEPKADLRWPGNVKKYKIGAEAKILDVTGSDAISVETGFFTDDSRSYWSNDEDGASVVEGGFAGELTAPRNLIASLSSASAAITSLSGDTIDAASINTTKILLDAGLIDELLGLKSNSSALSDVEAFSQAQAVIRWTLGEASPVDPDNPTRSNKYAAESIHSTPFVLSYGSSRAAPKDVVYLVTNQGLLHAITGQGADESDGLAGEVGGSERWAYLPDPDLLTNLGGYYNKKVGDSTEHIYGLDGEITALVERDVSNVLEKAHLFMTQRRGGKKIFAIDITNGYSRTNPLTKLWTVEGGSGDLKRLGYTWSKPIVSKFPVCTGSTCVERDVIVVGGGYDNDYDDNQVSVASLADSGPQDTIGNAVYILDAHTGAVLWSASNSPSNVSSSSMSDVVVAEMDHSIPSSPTVVDLDRDGLLDAIFVIDLAGQIFRFDFDLNSAGTSLAASGARIADLQESGVSRRFYNPLDAVVLPATGDGANNRIALVTGSGYRARPLTNEGFYNRFYVIYDENLSTPKPGNDGTLDYKYVSNDSGTVQSIIEANDLSEVDNTTTLAPGSTHKYGYYVNLVTGNIEKIINPTLIADFQAIGVSYKPSVDTSSLCASSVGNSQAYRLDLLTGETEVTALAKPGVSAAPVLVDILTTDSEGNESLQPIVIIGTEPFKGTETFELNEKNLGKAKKSAWWESGRGYGRKE